LLKVQTVDVFYGAIQCIRGASLGVEKGEFVSLVGSNGAGKTTLLKTISGLVKNSSGAVFFQEERIDRLSGHEIAQRGLILIPEGRRLFPYMTVLENLELGSYAQGNQGERGQKLKRVFELFPTAHEKRDQLCNSLSGGEQQMVAIGRGLMAGPKLLMLDEPSLGLSPIMVQLLFKTIKQIGEQGVTLLLVEQNVRLSLKVSLRGYVLENGRIVMEGNSKELLESQNLKKAFLGGR
jgi:branched-chain amino acid transport system ATP-binding protein